MRAVVQRVSGASVTVEQQVVGEIATGLLVLLGVSRDDAESDADYLVEKVAGLRIFEDPDGKMNLSVQNIDGNGAPGGLLLVSQFTLAADTNSGLRPSFTPAAPPEEGRRLFDYFVATAREKHPIVETGEFGADMQVSLVNDGPVTFWLQVRN